MMEDKSEEFSKVSVSTTVVNGEVLLHLGNLLNKSGNFFQTFRQ